MVATSTLDLGIDWGDVDLVVHVGAPKGASRLAQRIGRANHRMDEPSKGVLVPGNRFEVLECRAALDANYLGHQDTPPLRTGTLDVLCQHILGMAVAEPFDAVALHDEITSAASYRDLAWETFERAVDFVATGGYALRTYERYAKIRRRKDGPDKGRWGITHPRIAQQYRLNVGTIIEQPMLRVRLGKPRSAGKRGVIRGGKRARADRGIFPRAADAGRHVPLRRPRAPLRGHPRERGLSRARRTTENASIPSFEGGKFPLTTYLAARCGRSSPIRRAGRRCRNRCASGSATRRSARCFPARPTFWSRHFRIGGKFYMAAFPFEGRLAHQTLGMLLTRRLERAGARPLGFVATDYSLAVWALRDLGALFAAGRPSLAGALRRGHARRRPRSVDGGIPTS